MEKKEAIVKELLSTFLQKHNLEDSISYIDEIVLTYMVSILEELDTEDAFDVEEFIGMMDAYLPGFSEINSQEVCEWIFELAAQLNQVGQTETVPATPPVQDKQVSTWATNAILTNPQPKLPEVTKPNIQSEDGPLEQLQGDDRSEEESGEGEGEGGTDGQVDLLLEMFPNACSIEVRHCLCMAGGDMERAAQLVLHRQETGDCINSVKTQQGHHTGGKGDEKKLKADIVARYSYVDQDDDAREHRPVLPKNEPKKLLRYRDNQVVSTKGERYSEVKKREGEDMKKTYVNLKPARQYRFH